MKVLIVSNMFPDEKNPSYGIFVSHFCTQLGKLGIHYDKSVMYKGTNIINKIVNYIRFYSGTFLKCLLYKFDVVYVNYASHSSAPVIAANHLKKMNIVVNVHGSDVVPENAKQEKMQKYTQDILKYSTGVVVPSEYFRQYVHTKYDYKLENIFVYPSGGIDPNIFHPVGANLKATYISQFQLSTDKIRVGYIGRISAGKGWDTFIKAVAKLDSNKYEFILVGSGIKENQLNEQIRQFGIGEKIRRFPLMSQSKLAEMYNCLDVFVFPTEREGESLGLVAIEAMACGVPVISSDYAAPKYYVKDRNNGFKFKMGDECALSEALTIFANLPEKEGTVLEKGALDTAQNYFVDNILNALDNILKVIVNER